MEPIKGHTKKIGITGSTLKLIAIAAMIIDHTAAIVLERVLMVNGLGNALTDNTSIMAFALDNAVIFGLYTLMRLIGRLGFPIFCFLLIEGFTHTRNVKKYVARLALFAIISEIPFDFAFAGKVFYFGYQNVFFTLLIGLLVIVGFQWIGTKRNLNKFIVALAAVFILGVGMLLAEYLKTDYSSTGVAIIALLYLCRKKKPLLIVAGCIAFAWEVSAPLAFIPIALYNGKRGLNIKYFFYAFYPLHLMILYLICVFLGFGNIILR